MYLRPFVAALAFLVLPAHAAEPCRDATEMQASPSGSGLRYSAIREGSGATPTASDTVEVHYEGRLTDGTKFDSSYDRGKTIAFPLNGVIAGWTEGLQLMKEGAEYCFSIPSDLAYGARGIPGVIPPQATLVFRVELEAVR